MSADEDMPLFILDDEDNLSHEEDPAVILVRESLAMVERLQQERVEQGRLERAQH